MDKKELECIPTYPVSSGQTCWVLPIHQVWYLMGIQQHLYQTRRQMESSLPYLRRTLWTNSHVLWTDKLASHLSDDDEHHILMPSNAGIVFHLHGWWHYSHQTTIQRVWRIAYSPTLPLCPWDIQHSSRKWLICQTRKMCLQTRENWVPWCHYRKRAIMHGPYHGSLLNFNLVFQASKSCAQSHVHSHMLHHIVSHLIGHMTHHIIHHMISLTQHWSCDMMSQSRRF